MSLEVSGKLHKKFDIETRGEKGFRTRDFILEVADEKFPQMVKFQTIQDRTDQVDSFDEGDDIKVSFNLRGREWNGKYLTNLECWRIEKVGSGALNAPKKADLPLVQNVAGKTFKTAKTEMLPDDGNDLPF